MIKPTLKCKNKGGFKAFYNALGVDLESDPPYLQNLKGAAIVNQLGHLLPTSQLVPQYWTMQDLAAKNTYYVLYEKHIKSGTGLTAEFNVTILEMFTPNNQEDALAVRKACCELTNALAFLHPSICLLEAESRIGFSVNVNDIFHNFKYSNETPARLIKYLKAVVSRLQKPLTGSPQSV